MDTTNLNKENKELQLPEDLGLPTSNQQILNISKSVKKIGTDNSALRAASLGRSAVAHVKARRRTNKPGDFANSATNICYEN